MTKRDMVTIAWKNLMRRKGRTILTVLGMVIGVTAIIVMVSLGLGLSKSQMDMVKQWGSLNEVDVSPGWSNDGSDSPIKITDEVIAQIEQMEGVSSVIPMVRGNLPVKYGKLSGDLSLIGIAPEDMDKLGYTLGAGRSLQAGDRISVVLGSQVGDSFYDPTDEKYWENYQYDPEKIYQKTLAMVNQRLDGQLENFETSKIKKLKVEVVGVLSDEGNSGATWNVYAPLSFVEDCRKFTLTEEEKKAEKKNGKSYQQIKVLTEDMVYSKAIAEELTNQGYYADSIATTLEGLENQSRTIQAVLGGIGGITLLVAAISIINTMIMSIYERTKEIGVMKVIGASFHDVRMLFLTEAGLIGLMGGILGVLVSLGLSKLINQLAAAYMADMEMTLSLIPPWLVLFAVGFSILIGLVAGIYPANKAVKLSPIEAIRNNG